MERIWHRCYIEELHHYVVPAQGYEGRSGCTVQWIYSDLQGSSSRKIPCSLREQQQCGPTFQRLCTIRIRQEGMYRLPVEEAKKLLPQIPVHPISYKDAEPLLRTLTRNVVPSNSSFRGGLKFSYGIQMADDPREVEVSCTNELYVTDVYNLMGVIKGSTYPDELVLLGNHRDASQT